MIKNYDYEKHNDEYLNLVNGGKQPGRVLMALSANPRIMLSDPNNNPDRIIFENYMNDYSLMADISCRFQEYSSNQLFCDKIMGFENTDGFTMWYDSQNTEEHRYFGGDIVYHGFDVPSTVKLLNDNNKYAFIDKPFPAIDTGPYAYGHEYYMYCLDLQKNGFAWKGKPIKSVIDSCELGTDGPLTICCCLLGAGEICAALYEEEAFALDLLNYIADATIYRIKEGKKRIGQPEKARSMWFADDSIALLSVDDYKRFILPVHKRIFSELTTGEGVYTIHLCGDATRHYTLIRDELGITSFDSGFPVRHGELVQALGPDIELLGGVHINLLLNGTPEAVADEARRILEEVKPHTRRFILKEANSLAPRTPPENMLAMYNAVKKYGFY